MAHVSGSEYPDQFNNGLNTPTHLNGQLGVTIFATMIKYNKNEKRGLIK